MSGPNGREGHAAFILRMRARGIDDGGLFSAFETARRADFIAPQWRAAAWSPGMIPIACGEAMEGVDLQCQAIAALDLTGGERVLEIGTGTGYTAAVMAQLGARVVTIDRYRTLVEEASSRLARIGVSVAARHADGSRGILSEGPFDRVIVWAAFEQLPRHFVEQLVSGGTMIAPLGAPEERQTIVRLVKVGSRFDREDIGWARLQPLKSGLGAAL